MENHPSIYCPVYCHHFQHHHLATVPRWNGSYVAGATTAYINISVMVISWQNAHVLQSIVTKQTHSSISYLQVDNFHCAEQCQQFLPGSFQEICPSTET